MLRNTAHRRLSVAQTNDPLLGPGLTAVCNLVATGKDRNKGARQTGLFCALNGCNARKRINQGPQWIKATTQGFRTVAQSLSRCQVGVRHAFRQLANIIKGRGLARHSPALKGV